MNIGAIAYNYNNITKSQGNNHGVNNISSDAFSGIFANTALRNQVGPTTGIVLHGKNDADEGEKPVGAWADVRSGTSTSVYMPSDFSEENPYYHVKIWNPDGTMEERMVDVRNFDPRSADSFEQYVFACYLSKEENIPITSFVPAESEDAMRALREKRDWVQEYKEMMQQQYNAKNYEGYLRYKGIYERHLEQVTYLNNLSKPSDYKEVETANYKLVPEPEIGGLRIYVDGESAGVFKSSNLKIQEDAETGTKVLIGELAGYGSAWYDAIPVDAELEQALSEAMGVDEVPHKDLEGYYIGTHAGTGIRYLMRQGDEGKGGKVLLCNEIDKARYKALGEEYASKYPNLIKSPEEGMIYADFEIRGMTHRTESGIVMTHPDNISYNDNDNSRKNWSAMIDEKTWSLMFAWLKNHTHNLGEISRFRYWDNIFSEIGGTYERVWSDEELRQGYLFQ